MYVCLDVPIYDYVNILLLASYIINELVTPDFILDDFKMGPEKYEKFVSK